MRQRLYNFRNTKARQDRISDLQSEQSSSSVQVDIESSHTDTWEVFFDQDYDYNMDRGGNAGPDQQEERFLQLLDTLAQGQRLAKQRAQEHNQRMELMMQMMARQMGLNANIDGGNNQNGNNQNGNNQDGIHNGGEQIGNNFDHAPQQARTVSSRPMIPTFLPRAPEQPVPEPQITDIQDQLRRDWEAEGPNFTAAISFREYMDVRMKHMLHGHDRNQSYELRKKV